MKFLVLFLLSISIVKAADFFEIYNENEVWIFEHFEIKEGELQRKF